MISTRKLIDPLFARLAERGQHAATSAQWRVGIERKHAELRAMGAKTRALHRLALVRLGRAGGQATKTADELRAPLEALRSYVVEGLRPTGEMLTEVERAVEAFARDLDAQVEDGGRGVRDLFKEAKVAIEKNDAATALAALDGIREAIEKGEPNDDAQAPADAPSPTKPAKPTPAKPQAPPTAAGARSTVSHAVTVSLSMIRSASNLAATAASFDRMAAESRGAAAAQARAQAADARKSSASIVAFALSIDPTTKADPAKANAVLQGMAAVAEAVANGDFSKSKAAKLSKAVVALLQSMSKDTQSGDAIDGLDALDQAIEAGDVAGVDDALSTIAEALGFPPPNKAKTSRLGGWGLAG